MKLKLRVARATNDLKVISEMYRQGLGLEKLGSFENHAGFDGIMLGSAACDYHFEFTQEAGHRAPRSPSAESLLVFYVPESGEYEIAKERMENAGFARVRAHNPYWDEHGCTFEDPEGYRVVLCGRGWG